jgi:hypothetical protein
VDEFSGGESLVSALLQDPFSSEVESVRISKRWEGREQDSRLDIEYGSYVLSLSLVLIISQICRVSHRGYPKQPRKPFVFIIARYTFIVLASGIYALASAPNRTATDS